MTHDHLKTPVALMQHTLAVAVLSSTSTLVPNHPNTVIAHHRAPCTQKSTTSEILLLATTGTGSHSILRRHDPMIPRSTKISPLLSISTGILAASASER